MRNKKVTIILSAACASLLLAACGNSKYEKYDELINYLEAGDYESAYTVVTLLENQHKEEYAGQNRANLLVHLRQALSIHALQYREKDDAHRIDEDHEEIRNAKGQRYFPEGRDVPADGNPVAYDADNQHTSNIGKHQLDADFQIQSRFTADITDTADMRRP